MSKSAEGNLYVEHVFAGQWAPDERDDIILATALRDRRRYGPTQAPLIYIEQEPGSAGIDCFGISPGSCRASPSTPIGSRGPRR